MPPSTGKTAKRLSSFFSRRSTSNAEENNTSYSTRGPTSSNRFSQNPNEAGLAAPTAAGATQPTPYLQPQLSAESEVVCLYKEIEGLHSVIGSYNGKLHREYLLREAAVADLSSASNYGDRALADASSLKIELTNQRIKVLTSELQTFSRHLHSLQAKLDSILCQNPDIGHTDESNALGHFAGMNLAPGVSTPPEQMFVNTSQSVPLHSRMDENSQAFGAHRNPGTHGMALGSMGRSMSAQFSGHSELASILSGRYPSNYVDNSQPREIAYVEEDQSIFYSPIATPEKLPRNLSILDPHPSVDETDVYYDSPPVSVNNGTAGQPLNRAAPFENAFTAAGTIGVAPVVEINSQVIRSMEASVAGESGGSMDPSSSVDSKELEDTAPLRPLSALWADDAQEQVGDVIYSHPSESEPKSVPVESEAVEIEKASPQSSRKSSFDSTTSILKNRLGNNKPSSVSSGGRKKSVQFSDVDQIFRIASTPITKEAQLIPLGNLPVKRKTIPAVPAVPAVPAMPAMPVVAAMAAVPAMPTVSAIPERVDSVAEAGPLPEILRKDSASDIEYIEKSLPVKEQAVEDAATTDSRELSSGGKEQLDVLKPMMPDDLYREMYSAVSCQSEVLFGHVQSWFMPPSLPKDIESTAYNEVKWQIEEQLNDLLFSILQLLERISHQDYLQKSMGKQPVERTRRFSDHGQDWKLLYSVLLTAASMISSEREQLHIRDVYVCAQHEVEKAVFTMQAMLPDLVREGVPHFSNISKQLNSHFAQALPEPITNEPEEKKLPSRQ